MKALFFLCFLIPILADFIVSPAIGSHMVLQRAPYHASIYGETDPDDHVTVSFNGQTISATVEADGKWRALLPPTDADGVQYKFSVSSEKYNKSYDYEDILFGDVWLCSGQSNMEMTVRMSFDHDKTYEEALEHQDVRIFSIAHNEQDDKCFDDIPSNIVQLPWSRPNATTLGRDANDWSFFSATCWYYGLNLHKQINLPIGLIATSWGGTTVEAWSEPDVYNVQCPQKQSMNTRANPENDFFDQSFMGPNEHPSSLWNGMLHPFVRTTIKGAIWYQGEANEWNVGNYEQKTGYACRFPAMIASWRKHFSALEGTTDPNFPFGFVSITPWCENTCDPANQKPDTYYGPAEIRWAQQANFVNVPNRALPNVFMAMDYDLEDINVPNPPAGQIHPRNKYSVGERLALSAVKQVYEKKVTAQGPVLDGCSVSDKTIEVTFNSEELNGEFVDVKQTYGYEVEVDNSGNWYPVTIVGTKSANSIAIDASSINGAITGLRYAWRNSPCCPLLRDNSATVACVEKSCAIYNSVSDLPAVPFRVSIVDGKCVIPQ